MEAGGPRPAGRTRRPSSAAQTIGAGFGNLTVQVAAREAELAWFLARGAAPVPAVGTTRLIDIPEFPA